MRLFWHRSDRSPRLSENRFNLIYGRDIFETDSKFRKNSYPIYIENNILDKASSYISSCFSGKKIMIISDDNVFPLYGEKLKTSLGDYEVHELVLPHGEPTKAFETLPALYNALLKQKFPAVIW